MFPKVGKTTRPVGYSSTCTSDLFRRRVRLSRLSPSATPGRAAPGRAAPGSYRRPAGLWNATGGKASAHTTGPGFGMRPAAGLRNATRLRRTRPGHSVEKNVDRFRHAACSADPPWTDRTLSSFSSISPTITLLRSPNASSPHLASGSLLLPPFTHRSARNSVEKNVDRHLRFPN